MQRLLVSLLLPALAAAIAINNGIEGDPEVQCGPTSVQISFSSSAPFEGVVYAKGHHDDGACVTNGDRSTAGGGIEMDFESCNVRRLRSAEPRGIFVTATVVVQFHANVLTKIDRAFHIRCFYMEADKTVDQQLEVSMVTTELRTMNVPMPVCRYDILDTDENGAPVQFVIIGAKVFHKWTCDTETVDTFCMEVYGCYVDDSTGNQESTIQLVDDEGCALDRNLLSNIGYSTDLMAGVQSHVFKYADRPQLYFNCQIRIGVKEPGSDCQEFRGAPCPEALETFGRKKRALRARRDAKRDLGVMDVTPNHPVFVADLELSLDDIPARLRNVLNRSQAAPVAAAPAAQEDFCLSTIHASVVVIILAVFVVAAGGLAFALCGRRGKQ